MKFSKFQILLVFGLLALLAIWSPAAALLLMVTASAIVQILRGMSGKGSAFGIISSLGAATLNYQLTAYAQGLWNDIADVIKLAERLSPTTPVPGASGMFKKFDDKNSFLPEKTARARGPFSLFDIC